MSLRNRARRLRRSLGICKKYNFVNVPAGVVFQYSGWLFIKTKKGVRTDFGFGIDRLRYPEDNHTHWVKPGRKVKVVSTTFKL